MADSITIEILENGIIKTTTDKVSMPNHAGAEQFLREMSRLAGGKVERRHRHGHLVHSHDHDHGHEHKQEG